MKAQGMVDIETLSSQPDGAIIAIGLCIFDENNVWDEMEILIDPELAIGHRDPGTLEWWAEQDRDVFSRMMSGDKSPWEAADLFRRYFVDLHPGVKQLWANPPTFDIMMLRHWCQVCHVDFPIHFTGERDFRTMRKFADQLGVDYKEPYSERLAHDAKEDAVAQAKALQLILKGLALV